MFEDYSISVSGLRGFKLTWLQFTTILKMRFKKGLWEYLALFYEIFYPTLLLFVGALVYYSVMNLSGSYHFTQNKFPVKQNLVYTYNSSLIADPSIPEWIIGQYFNEGVFTPKYVA